MRALPYEPIAPSGSPSQRCHLGDQGFNIRILQDTNIQTIAEANPKLPAPKPHLQYRHAGD